jgi:hypothetical protein
VTPDTKRLREWECKPGCHLQPHDGPCLTETEIATLRRVAEAARAAGPWQTPSLTAALARLDAEGGTHGR